MRCVGMGFHSERALTAPLLGSVPSASYLRVESSFPWRCARNLQGKGVVKRETLGSDGDMVNQRRL